jgi:uncharacterized membrane protein required for colicin V production
MITIDWIILAVILIYFLIGLRRGFVRMVVHCIGGIFSYFVASSVASRFADSLSNAILVPYLSKTIESSILASNGETATSAEVWDAQSEYLRSLLIKGGMSEDTLALAANPVSTLSEAIAATVGHAIAYVILFLLVFFLCSLAISLIANVLNLVAYLPILHSFNSLLGGLLGAVFGLVLCTIILWTLKLLAPAVYSDYGILPPSEMSQSAIASTLVGWNDGVSLFEFAGTAE